MIKRDIKTDSVGTSPLKMKNGGTPLAPSARISALNIVGDLLRKVGVSGFIPSLYIAYVDVTLTVTYVDKTITCYQK